MVDPNSNPMPLLVSKKLTVAELYQELVGMLVFFLLRVHWLETPRSGHYSRLLFSSGSRALRYGPRVAKGVPERNDRARRLFKEKRAPVKLKRKQYIAGID